MGIVVCDAVVYAQAAFKVLAWTDILVRIIWTFFTFEGPSVFRRRQIGRNSKDLIPEKNRAYVSCFTAITIATAPGRSQICTLRAVLKKLSRAIT